MVQALPTLGGTSRAVRMRLPPDAEMSTRVVHCKREPYDVYIGRPSKWGNPYRIGDTQPMGTREEAIRTYEVWLQTQPHLLAALSELRGKVLGCWCAPRPCHGDVLARLAEEEAPTTKGETPR